jgi:hypothetical protein
MSVEYIGEDTDETWYKIRDLDYEHRKLRERGLLGKIQDLARTFNRLRQLAKKHPDSPVLLSSKSPEIFKI